MKGSEAAESAIWVDTSDSSIVHTQPGLPGSCGSGVCSQKHSGQSRRVSGQAKRFQGTCKIRGRFFGPLTDNHLLLIVFGAVEVPFCDCKP